MDEKRKNFLIEKYQEMPEEELAEMLLVDESEYEDGIYQLLLDAAKSRGIGVDTGMYREVTTKGNEIILKQKWKEDSINFYKKTSKILAVVWVLLTIFLFIVVPSYKIKNPIWLPLLSFIVCLKWFVLVWLIRVSVYKHFFWEKRMIREVTVHIPPGQW